MNKIEKEPQQNQEIEKIERLDIHLRNQAQIAVGRKVIEAGIMNENDWCEWILEGGSAAISRIIDNAGNVDVRDLIKAEQFDQAADILITILFPSGEENKKAA